jgi:hypothetical protein
MYAAIGRLAVFLLFLAAPACTARPSTKPAPDRNLITREQITEHRFNTAYEAVEALHANWLSTRGTDSFQSPGQVWVYLDNTKLGGVERLREIGASTIGSIRYYDGISATARWGLDHGHGVIFVSSRI